MQSNGHSFLGRLVSAALFAAATSVSLALDSTWTGNLSDDWNTSGNWSNGIPQNAGDDARFEKAANISIPNTITIRTLYVNAPVTLTVASGATLNFSNNGGAVIQSTADLTIGGAGDVTLSRNGTSDVDFADIRPTAGTTLTIAARISGLPDSGVELNLAGTLVLTNPNNSYTGYARITTGNGTFLFTDPGALGTKAIRFDANPCTFGYSGAGPATLTIPVTANNTGCTLVNSGSGALTISSDVSATSSGGRTLTFATPNAQPIIINGNVVDGAGTLALVHSGPAPLILNGANAYTGTTTINGPCVLNTDATAVTGAYTVNQGGTLTLNAGSVINGAITINANGTLAAENGALFQNPTLNMTAGARISFNPSADDNVAITLPLTNNLNGATVRWILPAAATASTVTVPELIQASGASLDILADDLGTPRNTLLIGNLTPGPLPSWITVNGAPAVYDATLGVMPATASGGTVSLLALGPSTVPNDPTLAAVINAQGTTGGIGLLADPTSIFSLTQAWAGNPATVSLGGKTLSASIVEIASGGNGLTLSGGTLTTPATQVPPPGPAVFPSTLQALPIAWFDFSDTATVTTDIDGRIISVENKGSFGAALDAIVPPDRIGPRYSPGTVNGLGVASSDSTNPQQGLATLGNPGISGNMPRTLFLVASRVPASPQFYAVWMGNDPGNNQSFGIIERNNNQTSFATTGNDLNSPTASPPGLNALTFISGLDGQPNEGAGFRNGDLIQQKAFAFNTTDTPIYLLHRPNGNANNTSGPGDMAEVILFDYTLTPPEREDVEAYLMHKWGIAVQRDETVLALRNANPAAELTIPAALTDPYGGFLSLIKSGPGDVTLAGPVSFSGTTLINDGTLTFDSPAGHTTYLAKSIAGDGSLNKRGPGNLALPALANLYLGGTFIQDGTLFSGDNDNTFGTGPIRIEGSGVLDLRYGAAGRVIANPVFVEGTGPDGLGALRNSILRNGFPVEKQNAFRNVTLTGNTALSADARFDVRNGAFDFGGSSLTLNGGGQFSIVNSTLSGIDPNVNVHVADGIFNFENTDFKGSAANTASADPGAGIAFYNLSVPFAWSVALADNAMFRASTGGMSTNINVQAGPVSLTDGTARFNTLADGTLTIPAVISGGGGILKEGPGWLWLLNPANTYAGATVITQGNLYAAAPQSLGTSGDINLSGAGASLIARAASATSPDGWPEPVIAAAITAVNAFDPDTFLGIDTCYDDFLYSGTYPFVGIKKLGPHKLTLTGTAPDLGAIVVYDGELDLSGTGPHNLHNFYARVGAQPDATMLGILRLEHATLDTTDPGYNAAGPELGAGIANGGRGIIHLGEGTRANGRLRLGTEANSVGAFYQTSGIVTNTGGNNYGAGIGVSGYGYYRLDDGEFASKGNTLFGENNGSFAIFEQRGGTALINPGGTPGNNVVGDYYGGSFATRRGTVQFMLSGGTLDLSLHSFQLAGWGGDNTDGIASLTLENDAQMSGVTVLTFANRNGPTEAYINLNGGALAVRDYIIKGGDNAAGNTARAAIAFNGGTLRVSPTTAAATSLVRTGANNTPPLLNVYSGGANIDIEPESAYVTLYEPLQAPARSGVTAVNITNPGAGYIAPPVVYFSGGGNGTGATAFAEIDLPSGTVTGIRVTSPGVGYTGTPTVNFRGGGATVAAAATATFGAFQSGGLTKLGPGLLSLNAQNTYTGPTVVSNGTLRLSAGSETLTVATPITLAGGTLDLGGAAHTNLNPVVIGDGGGLVNGTLAALSFTKTGPGTATFGATPVIRARDAFIQSLEPLIWYDPSDTTPGNITLSSSDHVIRIRNKGTGGDTLDAIPYNNGTGPLFLTGAASCSPVGAGTLHIDTANASMTTAGNVPITGDAPRTLIAMFARDNGTFGVSTGRAAVGLGGGGNTTSFEIGNDSSKTYLSALTLDLQFDQPNVPAIDQLTFFAGANGYNGNFARGVQIWRATDFGAFEYKPATWSADALLASAPFSIGRRGSGTNNGRGKYGDILLFDRVLSEDELMILKDVLVTKYVASSESGSGDDTSLVTVAEGTLVLTLAPTVNSGIIAQLNPLVWYDPSDTSTVTLDSAGRITALASKGSKPGMDAVSGWAYTGTTDLVAPLLATGSASYARTGLPMIKIGANNEGLASEDTLGISGTDPRTVVTVLTRESTGTSAVVCFGSPNPSEMWEVGDRMDASLVVIGGFSGYDLTMNPGNTPQEPNLYFASLSGPRTSEAWRTGVEPNHQTFTASGDFNTADSRFHIGQRAGASKGTEYRGQIGETLVFDRLLTEIERTDLQAYLTAKWMTGEFSDGTEFDGVTFDIAPAATLDLGGSERNGLILSGDGTIVNGILGAGSIISPAGDDAIGEQTFHNVTLAPGVVYRLTTDGNLSDRILIDGDLSALTIVPATDAQITGKTYVIATGAITGKPALDGFHIKFKIRQQGNDLLLTSTGGTVMILR